MKDSYNVSGRRVLGIVTIVCSWICIVGGPICVLIGIIVGASQNDWVAGWYFIGSGLGAEAEGWLEMPLGDLLFHYDSRIQTLEGYCQGLERRLSEMSAINLGANSKENPANPASISINEVSEEEVETLIKHYQALPLPSEGDMLNAMFEDAKNGKIEKTVFLKAFDALGYQLTPEQLAQLPIH